MAVCGQTSEKIKSLIREPKRYHVIMHNDDYTTMDFVVEILINIFHKNESEATMLMLTVHQSGKAVVGNYSYDIAISKVRAATDRAAAEGFPFRLTVEEA
ncbi:MAG: ATP-dependent Clp protease adaptor ClpS [Brotaphodocola sp.]